MFLFIASNFMGCVMAAVSSHSFILTKQSHLNCVKTTLYTQVDVFSIANSHKTALANYYPKISAGTR